MDSGIRARIGTDADPAGTTGVFARLKQIIDSYLEELLVPLDFWSVMQEEVAITSVPGDKSLPSVVVHDIPAGATVVIAKAMYKYASVENDNVGANALAGAQEIQVDDVGVSGWLDALNFVDDAYTMAAESERGGDVIIGAINVAAIVIGNDTYIFQWDQGVCDVDSLRYNIVQTGLRIWYSI